MLVSGAGSLMIAARAGWFAAYATMAAAPEYRDARIPARPGAGTAEDPWIAASTADWDAIREWLETAVVGPVADFTRRPAWLAILIFVVGYQVGRGDGGRDGNAFVRVAWVFAQ